MKINKKIKELEEHIDYLEKRLTALDDIIPKCLWLTRFRWEDIKNKKLREETKQEVICKQTFFGFPLKDSEMTLEKALDNLSDLKVRDYEIIYTKLTQASELDKKLNIYNDEQKQSKKES